MRLVDPDGREADDPITDKKKQRRQRRYNRKFQRKIVQRLENMWAAATEADASLTVSDAKSVLGAETKRLTQKYRKKNWLWGSKRGRTNGTRGRHSQTNARRVRTDVSILLTGSISREANGDNGRDLDGARAFGQTLSVGVPDGASDAVANTALFTISFDGNNEPDVLTVTGSGGAPLLSGEYGGLDASPITQTFTGRQTGGAIDATVTRRDNSPVQVSRFNLSVQVSYLNIRRSTVVTNGVLTGGR